MKPNRTSSSAERLSRFLTHVGIAALTLVFMPLAGADVIDSSLIIRFNFDAPPVGAVIVDTSPAGAHPGANIFATWQDSEAGRTGVMSFDGTLASQITLPAALDLNSSVGATTFWMKSALVTPSADAYAIIFDRRGNGGDVIYQEPGGHLADQAQQASGAQANAQTTGANLTDSNWHHVAYVYDQGPSGFFSFYVDGVLDASGANALSWSWVPDQEIEIGKSHASFWSAYTGFLDDFRIYNRILTAAEVADIAGLGTTPKIIINPAGQPQDLTVGEKDTPSITVKATLINGDPAQLRYHWQKDGADIPNATNASYSLTVSAADSGSKFRCQLTTPCAANLTSAQATLTAVPESTELYRFDHV